MYIGCSLALPARTARIDHNQIAIGTRNTCLLHAIAMSQMCTDIQLNNNADMTRGIRHS